ncbi:endonuclease III domain-containing protein [Halothermothrix orenii]|uniref:HhH-GPD family protein n=1 Tax=Halothermothrix orenii (strain H 168 / OCM 544 / DSM 9562) TaxID=373903 RepID=B8D108_HALOH|nr:endonuclease [Halothermothrix orenii]ACL68977.1 HhH-GPD family protein [Halothermothrix orenii H 168]
MSGCRGVFSNITWKAGLNEIYHRLYKKFGPQHWWPADSRFEVIIGAILTQAVSWQNVEKAIENLKKHKVLYPEELLHLEEEILAKMIKPAGYYNMKARKIKAFINFLFEDYGGSLDEMFQEPLSKIRDKLLEVYGIGPETADSILLYAGEFPVFVIDAYTKRIFSRIGYIEENIGYHTLQKMIMDNLPARTGIYNEYHALLVALGKEICKKNNPLCEKCPLNRK